MSDGRVVVTICAMDVGPANILSVLAEALTKKGCEVYTFLKGEGTPIIVDGTKFLILGMSSSLELAADEILLAGIAKAFQIPTIFIADTFDVWNRSWFEDFIPGSTVFVLNEDEAIKVRENFPTANAVVTGNLLWNESLPLPLTQLGVSINAMVAEIERVAVLTH